jgi:Protein of unknown function (DUF3667)
MSRLKERKQKNCLNCHIHVKGRFCHRCGQENIEPKESVWDLISHFFKDITHFDGKFFSTIKYLFRRPGFLSEEYMIGRRASYVNPIRLYIFTSAFFFLIFFSFMKLDKKTLVSQVNMNDKTYIQIEAMDSLAFDAFTKNVNKEDGKPGVPMTRPEFKKYFDSMALQGGLHFTNANYNSKAQYDSALAAGVKDNWLKRQLVYKQIELNEKYHNQGGQAVKDFADILLHSLPQIFFILLPIFALILKLLYFRRKNYYYVNHGIFSIHFYIFWFLTMLILFGLGELNDKLGWTVITILQVIIGLGIFFYLYKAMRNFYRQRRAKTVIKFIILCFSLFITILLLFLIFIFYSLYKL